MPTSSDACKNCGAFETELRRRVYSHGTHVGYQCLTCGRCASSWLPHSSVKNIERLPLFDQDIYDQWSKKQSDEYERRALIKAQDNAEFFASRAWLELRYRVLKTYGAKCMACHRDNCELHIDHVRPRSKYPELALDITNLQVLCADCNFGKGAWDQTDWRLAPEGR